MRVVGAGFWLARNDPQDYTNATKGAFVPPQTNNYNAAMGAVDPRGYRWTLTMFARQAPQ
jgi:hypothetical protein